MRLTLLRGHHCHNAGKQTVHAATIDKLAIGFGGNNGGVQSDILPSVAGLAFRFRLLLMPRVLPQ